MEPQQESDQGGLARSRGSDQSYGLPGRDLEVDSPENVLPSRVRETDVLEPDVPLDFLDAGVALNHSDLRVEQVKHPGGRC